MPYMDEDVRARLAELVEEIEGSTFRETRWGRRGYSERDVDDFLDYLVDVLFHLLSAAEVAEAPMVPVAPTPAEVAAPEETQVDLGEEMDEATGEMTLAGSAADAPTVVTSSVGTAGANPADAGPEEAPSEASQPEEPAPKASTPEGSQPPPPPWVRP